LGNGDGTFTFQGATQSTGEYATTAVGDFNGDGNLDLACVQVPSLLPNGTPYSLFVEISLGNGDGTFQSPILRVETAPFYIRMTNLAIVPGDFNGDGKLDFALPGVAADVATMLQGSIPVLNVSPNTLSFPDQIAGTTSSAQNITLTNTGTGVMSISVPSIEFSGANLTKFTQTNTCTSLLLAQATCQISVIFTPAPSDSGKLSATLSISDNAPGTPQTMSVSGTATPPAPPAPPPPAPIVSLSPSTFTFPSQYVGTSGLPQTLTVTNTGSATLNVTAVNASPADFGVLSNCTNPVAVGSSCTIGVFFDPTAGGTRTGTLKITDNAGNSPQTVTLTGSGQDFSMTPGSGSSATVTAGQTANYSIAVAPAGGFAASVALSCSGGPAQSTCTVSPNTMALSGTTAKTAMVTVTTVAGAQAPLLPFATGWPTTYWQTPILAWIGMFLLIAVVLSRWRQEQRFRWAPAFALALLVCLGMTLASCGGGSSSGGGGGGTQAGTYAITVTGNFSSGSTNLTHATKLTLVVQ
jgi:hypothetical protein